MLFRLLSVTQISRPFREADIKAVSRGVQRAERTQYSKQGKGDFKYGKKQNNNKD